MKYEPAFFYKDLSENSKADDGVGRLVAWNLYTTNSDRRPYPD